MKRFNVSIIMWSLKNAIFDFFVQKPCGNGLWRHESHCDAFYHCYGGIKFPVQFCPTGLLFNQKIAACDWPRNVDCSKCQQINLKENIFCFKIVKWKQFDVVSDFEPNSCDKKIDNVTLIVCFHFTNPKIWFIYLY